MPHPIQAHLQVSLFHVERSSYRSLQLVDNTHPYWAVSYVAQGQVETRSRGITCTAHAGDAMIHPPAVAYSELAAIPGTHEWFLLEAMLSSHVDALRFYPVSPVVRIAQKELFSNLFASLLSTWQDEAAPFRDLSLLALTTQLLTLILQNWQQAGAQPRPPAMLTAEDRFTSVINYMADHLAEKLSRDVLAELMGFHPVYFDRLFRQTYGLPPMQMLREMRLQRARDLLASTTDTHAAIAYTCGFASAAAFSRAFQQRFGQTPSDYREGLKLARDRYVPFL